MKHVTRPILIVLCLACSGFAGGLKFKPTYQNVSYGPHPANKLDLYLAASPKPTPILIFIHGGAFAGGDKAKNISRRLINLCLENQISVASINYRLSKDKDYHFKYSPQTPFPPAMVDGARAVQFIRYHAAKYHLNKKQLALSGGSAGGGLSLWLAFHDDLAKPHAKDPIRRESTKPVCVISLAAQTTYDPQYITRHMNYNGYQIRWINRFLQESTERLKSPATAQLRKNVSPLEHVDANDHVAIFMIQGNEDKVTPDMPQSKFVHNVIFSRELEKKLKTFGIPYKLTLHSDYQSGKRKGNLLEDALHFMQNAFEQYGK